MSGATARGGASVCLGVRGVLFVAFLWVAGPVAAADEVLAVQVAVPDAPVSFGRGFPLTVVRAWSTGLAPEPWSDQPLPPLVVRLVDEERRERDGRVEDVRRYEAHAFALGELVVPAPFLRARPVTGGAWRHATGDDLVLHVESSLPAGDPGVAELPEGPLRIARPWWTSGSAVLVAAVAAVAALAAVARRRSRADVPVGRRGATAQERALGRLSALRGAQPSDRDELQAYYGEATDVVRVALEGRFGLPAPAMTPDEYLAAALDGGLLPAGQWEALGEMMAHCDGVKFGCGRSSATVRQRLVDAIEDVVTGDPW